MKSADAENVAKELVKVFACLGIPREILSDQGSSFQSKLLQELYRLLRVEALRMSPYHPQTDGLVEHFNKTLEDLDMLRKAATEDGKDWDKLIPDLLRKLGDQLSRNQCHLKIVTGENAAIRPPPYRLPHARRSQVEQSYQFTVRYRPGKQNSSYRGLIVTDIKQVDAGEGGRDVRVWTLTLLLFLALSLFLVLELVLFVQSCEYMYQYPL